MTTPEDLVSVIVPVYNGEEHLAACLRSVTRQSHRNLEVIVVDDGSTDGTARILDRAVGQDIRIRAIHRANGGVSTARNAGLDIATGEWIMFVDADDMMSDPLLVESVVLAGGPGVDLIRFDSTSDQRSAGPGPAGHGSRARGIAARARDVTLDSPTLAEMIAEETLNALWDKAYRRDVLIARRCRFREGTRMGEDLLFNLAYIRLGAVVRSLPITGYFYRQDNASSATSRYLPEKYSDLMEVNDQLRGWAREVGAGELHGAAEYIRAKNVVSCIRDLHHDDCGLSTRDRLATARRYKNQVPSVRARGVGAKRRVLGEFYNRLGFRSVFHLTRLLALR